MIKFARGEKEADIEIPVIDDTIPESDEFFYVELFEPAGKLVSISFIMIMSII